jgi:uncharacterized membrane protein
MYSKVKIGGHPIHPMLIAFPVAFYTSALICYIVYGSNQNVFWFKVAVAANIAGVVMALIAAIPGFIDWLFIDKTSKAKQTGLSHMIFNVTALLCFAVTAWLESPQWNDATPELGMAIPLAAIGFALTLIAGFLGWTLVQTHHVGVDEDVEVKKDLEFSKGKM